MYGDGHVKGKARVEAARGVPSLTGLALDLRFPGTDVPGFPVVPLRGWRVIIPTQV
jgi:hypothetical protein